MTSRAFLLLSVLAACADLPEVPAGTCGNHVIEAGEDCDAFPDPAHGGPGLSCQQCAYACDPMAAVIACPAGWGCGIDRRCRHGTGTFEPAVAEPASFPADALVVGDRDGDAAMELVGGGDGHVGTLTAANRQLAYTITSTLGSAGLVAADLDGDGVVEVLRPAIRGGVQGSLGVRGGSARTMLALGTFDLDQTTPGDQPAPPLTELVTVHLDDGTVVPYALVPQATGLAWLDLSRAVRGAPEPTGIQGDPSRLLVAVGNIDDAALLKRGQEIAIGFAGDTTLYVRRPDVTALLAISLPAPLVAKPIFGDVDADGFVDLLAAIEGPAVAVAKGDGTTLAAAAAVDTRFSLQAPADCGTGSSPSMGPAPRLIADLDGNGVTDYVTRQGIALGLVNGRFCTAIGADLSAEASVVALDANGDGRLDVAMASGLDTKVTLAVNQGGASFGVRSISVTNVPIELHAGAFDWDGFDDLLVVEAPKDGVSRLEIAKGTDLAASQVVLSAPDAPELSALASGAFDGDGVDDLVMLGTEQGRAAPYLAQVALVGEGLEFFSQIGGPAFGRVARILIGSLGGTPGENDVVVVFETQLRGETTAWVFPDQGSYLTDRGAYEAAVIAENATAPASLADLDGDGIDELVVAGVQDLAIYDLVAPSSTALRVAAPAATALTTVRRGGGDCLLLTGELTGAALACDLAGAPTSVVLSTSPVFGAVTANLDADADSEAVLVLGSTLATYELAPVSELATFTLDATRASPVAVCSGDLDGDGVSDLALRSGATVELRWGVPHDRSPP